MESTIMGENLDFFTGISYMDFMSVDGIEWDTHGKPYQGKLSTKYDEVGSEDVSWLSYYSYCHGISWCDNNHSKITIDINI